MNKNIQGSLNAKKLRGGIFPFLIEFVKFSVGFSVIVAVGLLSLDIAKATL